MEKDFEKEGTEVPGFFVLFMPAAFRIPRRIYLS